MKEKIHAISYGDLNGLIESLGLTADLQMGTLFCSSCGKKLSEDNIGCIYPLENEIKLCCDSLDCLEKALENTSPIRQLHNNEGVANEP